jgi:hypothetical protein
MSSIKPLLALADTVSLLTDIRIERRETDMTAYRRKISSAQDSASAARQRNIVDGEILVRRPTQISALTTITIEHVQSVTLQEKRMSTCLWPVDASAFEL